MLRYLIGAILLGHGLIITAQSIGNLRAISSQPPNPVWLGWWPTRLGQSWLLAALSLEGTLVDRAFGLLWLASGGCLVAAALGVLGWIVPASLWRTLAVYGASGSLVMLLLYLHPMFVIGLLVDLGILAALLWANWPSPGTLSAGVAIFPI